MLFAALVETGYFLFIKILFAALFQADRLKEAGLTIIPVGVTHNIRISELKKVASKPQYVITASDYSRLDDIASKTSDIICSEAKKLTRKKQVR